MEVLLRRKLIVCTFFVLIQVVVNCAEGSDSNATFYENVDANTLLKLGRKFNKPLLTLIGTVITNLHACTQWSAWSTCSAMSTGYFGMKRRTRKCGVNSQQPLEEKTETDFSVCTGRCPEDYNITTNGFCMKPYKVSTNHEGAQKQCNNDGSHLVHMDSELKYTDIKTFRKQISSDIYIDGRRKDINSPWLTSDGTHVEFFKWASSEPSKGRNELCVVVSSDYNMYDVPCTGSRAYVCEISI